MCVHTCVRVYLTSGSGSIASSSLPPPGRSMTLRLSCPSRPPPAPAAGDASRLLFTLPAAPGCRRGCCRGTSTPLHDCTSTVLLALLPVAVGDAKRRRATNGASLL